MEQHGSSVGKESNEKKRERENEIKRENKGKK